MLAPAAQSCVGLVHVRRCTYKHFSLVLCCEGFLRPASLTQRDESQRIEVQCRVSVSGRSIAHLHSPFSSPCRTLLRRSPRGWRVLIGALRERKGASNVWWGSTKDQTAPEGASLMCLTLRPTTEITHFPSSCLENSTTASALLIFEAPAATRGLKSMASSRTTRKCSTR